MWYLLFSAEDFFVSDGDEGYYFGKKSDRPLTESADECTKFLTCTLFFNALIVVTTCGLAPHYKRVQYCSVASLVSTFVNTFLAPKTAEECPSRFSFSFLSPATCFRTLSFLTCAPLISYSLL
ncbi:MFS transporter [Babesia caballi]|uniref:MFS transporter n=1 Tax=Babesia caballi TaxID=5871 RepID=A0AAV4M123_BABCB|nr:MFS transporter [Babesia caballi]